MAFGRQVALAAAAGLMLAAGAGAQQERPAQAPCTAPGELPQHFASWETRTALNATPGAYDLAVAKLTVGEAADVTLKPVEEVDFVVDPERWPEPDTYAGMLSFEALAPGSYTVGISTGAWIDVVADDELVPSAAFGLQPRCTGITKAVAFDLEPGVYALQLSANVDPAISVMIGYQPAE